MKARSLLIVTFAASALALGGCKGLLKKKSDTDAAAASASAALAAAAAAVAAASVAATPSAAPAADYAAPAVAFDEATVPTPQDFEDEAAEKVTQANFKAEFARIQKEISK